MTVIGGGSRSNGDYWTWHLQRTDGGQSFAIRDVVGLMGQDMDGWFAQMEAMSAGGKTQNYFYHFHLDPREGEAFTPEQLKIAVATALENLGLENQPYFLVEHDKNGRSPHFHCIALRVDLDTGKAISDSHDYRVHQRTADQLEELFGHEHTTREHGPDGPNPKGYEVQRGQRTGIDPEDVAAELKALWHQCDSGQAFAAALEEHGYILARGDRRDFVVVDQAGSDHSLARRVGAKAAEIRARMATVDRDALPTVSEARALARERAAGREDRDDTPLPDPSAVAGDKDKHPSAFEHLAEELLEAAHGAGAPAKPPPPETPAREVPANTLEELAQAAKEAEPTLADLGAAVAAETHDHDVPAERSVFDRVTAERFDALRSAPGDEDFIREGIDWQARQSGTPYYSDKSGQEMPTAFERVTRATFRAARDNGGEPVTRDGEGFWHRAISVIAEALRRVREAAMGFVDRLMQRRDPNRDDHERER